VGKDKTDDRSERNFDKETSGNKKGTRRERHKGEGIGTNTSKAVIRQKRRFREPKHMPYSQDTRTEKQGFKPDGQSATTSQTTPARRTKTQKKECGRDYQL